MQQKDVVGEKYNKLTIIGLAESTREPSGRLVKRVSVICDCGNTKDSVGHRDIKRGKTKSCGCLCIPKTIVDIGDKYNLWTVYDNNFIPINGNSYIGVRCICGKEKTVMLRSLKIEESKSCGCQGRIKVVKEKTPIPIDTDDEKWKKYNEHILISNWGNFFNIKTRNYFGGKDKKEVHINDSEYIINSLILKIFYPQYKDKYVKVIKRPIMEENLIIQNKEDRNLLLIKYGSMKSRCYNKNNPDYKSYGAKGITVCDEWVNSSGTFISWAINTQNFKKENNYQLDRINSDLGYSSNNCRFISSDVNLLNMRSVNLIEKDVEWIRSNDFNMDRALEKYICSKKVIGKIRNYKTFKNM